MSQKMPTYKILLGITSIFLQLFKEQISLKEIKIKQGQKIPFLVLIVLLQEKSVREKDDSELALLSFKFLILWVYTPFLHFQFIPYGKTYIPGKNNKKFLKQEKNTLREQLK